MSYEEMADALAEGFKAGNSGDSALDALKARLVDDGMEWMDFDIPAANGSAETANNNPEMPDSWNDLVRELQAADSDEDIDAVLNNFNNGTDNTGGNFGDVGEIIKSSRRYWVENSGGKWRELLATTADMREIHHWNINAVIYGYYG